MPRAFTERERKTIRQGLISACKECWNRYGYQKTGIRELAAIAGISGAAFYQFYESKEMLFIETAHAYEQEMEELFHEHMKAQPDKTGIAASLKALADWIAKSPWITAMWSDWPMISRKLPPDYMEKDFLKDQSRIEGIAREYGLKPRRNMALVTQVVDILIASITRLDYIPGDTAEAANLIIDAVVNDLFE